MVWHVFDHPAPLRRALVAVVAAGGDARARFFIIIFYQKNMTKKGHIFDQEYDLKRSYFRAFGPIFTKKKHIKNMTKKDHKYDQKKY